MFAELSPLVDRGLRLARVDFDPKTPAHRQPSGLRVVAALALSVAGSLAVDALLVTLGEAVFPSTKGFRSLRVLRLRQADRHRRG